MTRCLSKLACTCTWVRRCGERERETERKRERGGSLIKGEAGEEIATFLMVALFRVHTRELGRDPGPP